MENETERVIRHDQPIPLEAPKEIEQPAAPEGEEKTDGEVTKPDRVARVDVGEGNE
jgi:hypothetical protein